MDAVLKGAIVLADAANGLLLQAALRTDREMSVTRLSSPRAPEAMRTWAAGLDEDALLRAHALRVYRSKVVVHFSRPRVGSSLMMGGDWHGRRLNAFHFGAPSDELHAVLERMWKRY